MAYLEELLPELRNGAKIRVLGWDDGKYYYFKNEIIYNQNNKEIKELSLSLLFSDLWEIYEEPIDWDYIIKNKCLCWFWDEDESLKSIATLCFEDNHNLNNPYLNEYDDWYKNCRPIRRNEVTFYEDRKDD